MEEEKSDNKSDSIIISNAAQARSALNSGEWTLTDVVSSFPSPAASVTIDLTTEEENQIFPPIIFSASKVAAAVGLHEYCDLRQDFLDAIYHRLPSMLENDANLLSLTLAPSPEVRIQTLVSQLDSALKPVIAPVLSGIKNTTSPTDTETIKNWSSTVTKVIEKAVRDKSLGAEDAAELSKALYGKIRTNAGIRNEHVAIAAYEAQTGSTVRDCNTRVYTLEAKKIQDETVDTSLWHQNISRRSDPRIENTDTAAFFIRGKVDGMTEVLRFDSEINDWTLEPMVIEIKYRTARFSEPPPIYDQIQTAVYMEMTSCRHADLVQCMSSSSTTFGRGSEIKINRLGLDLPPLETGKAWREIVVPRLYLYSKAVTYFRNNNTERRILLAADEETQRDIILQHCPFLSYNG